MVRAAKSHICKGKLAFERRSNPAKIFGVKNGFSVKNPRANENL